MHVEQTLNTVDLFCGAGGLTCGFEGADAARFRTVMGLDNEPSAIRIFNKNVHSQTKDALFPVGRTGDATWFKHVSEIRLFYLAHVAYSTNDATLQNALRKMGLLEFLQSLRRCDEEFDAAVDGLPRDAEYSRASRAIPPAALGLALPKAILARLALRSLRDPELAGGNTLWTEEYRHLTQPNVEQDTAALPLDKTLESSCREVWDAQVGRLEEAATKTGNAQNRNNAKHLECISSFLTSEHGARLGAIWVRWSATRETARARFCLENRVDIDRLYFGAYKVHVVLGGPPCKGFSRIGRPVIESLRRQGVHAWSNTEFGDERNALMCQYVLFLEALEPDVFLFENVANFQSALRTPGGSLDAPALLMELIDALSEGDLHYDVGHKVLNARHFAVPQDRKRFIMFGAKKSSTSAGVVEAFFADYNSRGDVPLSTALSGLSDAKRASNGSSADSKAYVYHFVDDRMPVEQKIYLKWVMQPDPRKGTPTLETDAHIFRPSREDDLAFLEYVAPGIRWMDLKIEKSPTLALLRQTLSAVSAANLDSRVAADVKFLHQLSDSSLVLRFLLEHIRETYRLSEQHLLLDGYLKNGGTSHGDWFERLSPERPCKTIVAHIGKDTYGYWHPSLPRALSIREAARVQAFPDRFSFAGEGIVNTYTMIGNAVPPLLGKALAERIIALDRAFNLFHAEQGTSTPGVVSSREAAIAPKRVTMSGLRTQPRRFGGH